MTDAETGGLMEQMYCSQQINVPLNLPYILKQYAKAAIRTQPADLLYWSAVYFRALADGTTPPVKDRLEYPPLTTPSGLSPGFLKVLIKLFGKKGVVREEEIEEKWLGVGLKLNSLMDLFRLTNNENAKVRWLIFVAVAAGHLCPSLTQTMILICELLTDDPDGGPAAIKLDIFLPLYKFLARLNCGPVIKCDAISTNTIDEICNTRPHSFSSVQVDNETDKSADAECEPGVEKKYSEMGEKYASDSGIPVWEDVRPNIFKKSTSPRPSSEGMTSEAGIVVFDRINEDFVTPGFTKTPPESEPVSPTKSKEMAKPKAPHTVNKELIGDFEGIEIPSKDLGGQDDNLDKIVSAYGEEVKEEDVVEEDKELDENEDQPPIDDAETAGLDEQGGDDVKEDKEYNEERRVSQQLKDRLLEEKRLRELEKAERKRLREEARAQKKQLKEQKKAEAAAAKGDKEEDGEKKARRKKKKLVKTDSEEPEGEAEETEDEDDGSADELINEEDLDEESSTASSSISIDPDLEVFSSSEILGEDEYWEVIEIEEESLDDEEQKIIRKVKKRVKRKMEKKVEEVDAGTSKEIEDDKKAVMSDEEKKQAFEDSMSIEGIQGRPKEEVRVSGIINLQLDREDIASMISEPEQFEVSLAHVLGIGPIVPENQIIAVVKYMAEWASKQGGYVMPRNIRHFLCPPLDAENDESLSGVSSVKSNKGDK